MACSQFGTKQLPESMLAYSIGPPGTNTNEIWVEIESFSFKQMYLKMLSVKGGHFIQDDCPGRLWRRRRQASTSQVTTKAVIMTTFPF